MVREVGQWSDIVGAAMIHTFLPDWVKRHAQWAPRTDWA